MVLLEAAAECRRLVWHILAAQTLAVRAAVTGCTSGKEIASCRWNSNQCARGGSAEWRLHMGYDPHTCQFTDFELTDSRDAERLDRFKTADEIRIADGDSVRVPNVSAHLLLEKLGLYRPGSLARIALVNCRRNAL